MGEIIDKQYGHNLGACNGSAVIDVISPLSALDNELHRWEAALPHDLKTLNSAAVKDSLYRHQPSGEGDMALRFRVVLTLRSLNLTIFLHRPALVKYFELSSLQMVMDETDRILLSRLGRTSIDVCLRSAQEIISIVSFLATSEARARNLLNAWWFTLYYSRSIYLALRSQSLGFTADLDPSIQRRSGSGRHLPHHTRPDHSGPAATCRLPRRARPSCAGAVSS